MCVEIGVRGGMSTSALLAGIEKHGGHLWSFDINDCPVFRGHPQWTFTQIDTVKQPKEALDCAPIFIKVAFIDGDHSYEGALSDIETFGSRAEIIFVHDTDAPDYPGVRKAVEDFCLRNNRKAVYHHGSYGMAEIH